MRTIFADTNYFFALLNKNDGLHARAVDVSKDCLPCQTVTTEFVLIEVLRLLAKRGAALRKAGVELCDRLREESNCEVVPATRDLFEKAKQMYAEHRDKNWDLVDCASFVVMGEHGITEALTNDQHFAQMGFGALLRAE